MIMMFLDERRFRKNLDSQGRYITLGELKEELTAGYGTIIEEVEYRKESHFRFWWTKDDLFAVGQPLSDSEEIRAVIRGERFHEFNSRIVNEYLDEHLGKAALLSIPSRAAHATEISRKYPKMQIAKVYRELGNAVTGWAAS
jgi:hypothetical protein